MVLQGNGATSDPARGRALLQPACDGGFCPACERREGSAAGPGAGCGSLPARAATMPRHGRD
jgi:hypothetical protein